MQIDLNVYTFRDSRKILYSRDYNKDFGSGDSKRTCVIFLEKQLQLEYSPIIFKKHWSVV